MQIDPDALQQDTATLQLKLRTVLLQQGALAAENDKMRLLIQRLTRHQFGRRSEQLTPDQLQLALEELEQTIAANQAGQDAVAAAVGLPRQPRPTRRVATTGRSGSPAAIRAGGRRRGPRLSVLRPCPACRRRVADRAAGHRALPTAGAGRSGGRATPATAIRRCVTGLDQGPASVSTEMRMDPSEWTLIEDRCGKFVDDYQHTARRAMEIQKRLDRQTHPLAIFDGLR